MSRIWTKQELDFIAENWGCMTIPTIAKKLDRTINGIRIKAIRTGLGSHIHSGSLITLNQLCQAIGKKNSYSWISDKWVREGLPISYKKSVTKKYAMISIDEFWEWAETHKHLIDFVAFEKYSLGAEPEWVEVARHAAWLAQAKKTPWTLEEDKKLTDLLKQYKHTYNDLCVMMRRTEGAIKRRIITLNLRERPIRNYDKHWSEDETETLLKLRAEGHCWDEIGRRLSRSGSATRVKYERLQNPEYCKRYYRHMEDKQWVSIRDITPEQMMEGRK